MLGIIKDREVDFEFLNMICQLLRRLHITAYPNDVNLLFLIHLRQLDKFRRLLVGYWALKIQKSNNGGISTP